MKDSADDGVGTGNGAGIVSRGGGKRKGFERLKSVLEEFEGELEARIRLADAFDAASTENRSARWAAHEGRTSYAVDELKKGKVYVEVLQKLYEAFPEIVGKEAEEKLEKYSKIVKFY